MLLPWKSSIKYLSAKTIRSTQFFSTSTHFTFHFIEPLIRHLGQPTSCLLQAVSCQKSTVIIPHPSQNVSSYSFLTTSPDSNDLQLYDLAPLYEICPFSCLLPFQSQIVHYHLFTSTIFQGLLH